MEAAALLPAGAVGVCPAPTEVLLPPVEPPVPVPVGAATPEPVVVAAVGVVVEAVAGAAAAVALLAGAEAVEQTT